MNRILLAGSLAFNSLALVALSDVSHDNLVLSDVDPKYVLDMLHIENYAHVFDIVTRSSHAFYRLKEQYLKDDKHFSELVAESHSQVVFHNMIATKNACYAELLMQRRYATYLSERFTN